MTRTIRHPIGTIWRYENCEFGEWHSRKYSRIVRKTLKTQNHIQQQCNICAYTKMDKMKLLCRRGKMRPQHINTDIHNQNKQLFQEVYGNLYRVFGFSGDQIHKQWLLIFSISFWFWHKASFLMILHFCYFEPLHISFFGVLFVCRGVFVYVCCFHSRYSSSCCCCCDLTS